MTFFPKTIVAEKQEKRNLEKFFGKNYEAYGNTKKRTWRFG